MKYLVVVRHADIFGAMSDWMKSEVLKLAERLKPYTVGTVMVVTSQEKRAYLTGTVLAEAFGANLEQRGSLNPPAWSFVENAKRLGENVHTLLVVAHDDTCTHFPGEFGRAVLDTDIPQGYLHYLEALVIDCETKETVKLSEVS